MQEYLKSPRLESRIKNGMNGGDTIICRWSFADLVLLPADGSLEL
jgi:hypothetical protein